MGKSHQIIKRKAEKTMLKEQLDKIMKPKSIAVVGASTKEKTIGSEIMKRLIEYGFTGDIYPVNPKGGVIEGKQAYTSVLEIPSNVDFAMLIIPKDFIMDTLAQCNEKGIKGICIISAGFKETGAEGLKLEQELAETLQKYGMRCVGPNCLGVLNTCHQFKWMQLSLKSFLNARYRFCFSIRRTWRRYFEYFKRLKRWILSNLFLSETKLTSTLKQ